MTCIKIDHVLLELIMTDSHFTWQSRKTSVAFCFTIWFTLHGFLKTWQLSKGMGGEIEWGE